MQTPFADGTFSAITAISVIEHGFQGQKLFKEISRLLRPGGYFIASFDYWPDKVQTRGIKIFGMEWTIFSKPEVMNMIREAEGCSLFPVGELKLDAMDHPIENCDKKYTFAWLALQKLPTTSPDERMSQGKGHARIQQ
jgi:SAM-dependent methyltransferase